ncbi:MAG: peptidoglycan-associated lipoprotein Pal [Syntrophales bacterium]|jgi:peptidoglycan-associated lipoprotein
MKKGFLYIGIILLLMCFIFGMNGCASKQTLKAEEVTVAQKAPEAEQAGAVKTQPEAAPEQKTPVAQPPVQETKESAPAAQAPAVSAQPVQAETAQSAEGYEPADVHFDFDMYNLSPEARKILDKHAEWLAKNPGSLIIEGNCDERGTIEYNLALGQRRAEEAKKYLVGLGIDPSRIKTISYGKERPLDPEQNEDAWAKNRRDHFIIKKFK